MTGVIIIVILALILAAMVIIKRPATGDKYISRDEAYKTALEDTGKTRKQITCEILMFDEEEDPPEYKIFLYDKKNYWKYYIDAGDGSIIKRSVLDEGGPHYKKYKNKDLRDVDL